MTAIAGCSSSESDVSEQEQQDGSEQEQEESTTEPVSQLDVVGFYAANADEDKYQTPVTVSNPTEDSVTANFSSSFILSGADNLTSDPVEQTIPPGETSEFRIDVAPNTQPYEILEALSYNPFTVQISVNGETKRNTCPDSAESLDTITATEQGCEYPYGAIQTYVQVEYSGDWQGSVSTGESSRSVDKSSAYLSGPTSYMNVANLAETSSIVSANAQKQEANSEELTIQIVHRGETLAEESTSSEFGLAQISTDI
jgi:hypothetical protein